MVLIAIKTLLQSIVILSTMTEHHIKHSIHQYILKSGEIFPHHHHLLHLDVPGPDVEVPLGEVDDPALADWLIALGALAVVP